MARYIFRFRGHTEGDGNGSSNGYGSDPRTSEDELTQAIKHADAKVVDKSSSKMMLVEADAMAVAELRLSLPDWIITPEHSVHLPDARKKIKTQS